MSDGATTEAEALEASHGSMVSRRCTIILTSDNHVFQIVYTSKLSVWTVAAPPVLVRSCLNTNDLHGFTTEAATAIFGSL